MRRRRPLDKSHGGAGAAAAALPAGRLSSVVCGDPLLKASFLGAVASGAGAPVLYLDFDLMYSGLLAAGELRAPPGLRLYRPGRAELPGALREVLGEISGRASVVVVDSLNGLVSAVGGAGAGRLAASYLMMLDFVARTTGTRAVAASVARDRGGGDWALSPTGRRAPAAGTAARMHLRRAGAGAELLPLDGPGGAVPVPCA